MFVNTKAVLKRGTPYRIALQYPSSQRLRIVSILLDARCDIHHVDSNGWSVLHYACAHGALDVVRELVDRRQVRLAYNSLGYGPRDFIVRRIKRTDTLLKHTTQLEHESAVREAWSCFEEQICRQYGCALKCPEVGDADERDPMSFRCCVCVDLCVCMDVCGLYRVFMYIHPYT